MVLRIVNTEGINQIWVELDVYDKYRWKTTLSWWFLKDYVSEKCQSDQIHIWTCWPVTLYTYCRKLRLKSLKMTTCSIICFRVTIFREFIRGYQPQFLQLSCKTNCHMFAMVYSDVRIKTATGFAAKGDLQHNMLFGHHLQRIHLLLSLPNHVTDM